MMFKVVIKELIQRGHEITLISPFTFDEKLENYTEIIIQPSWTPGEHCNLFYLIISDISFNNLFLCV